MEVRNRVSGHDRFPAQRYVDNRWICVAGMNHIDRGLCRHSHKPELPAFIKHKNVYKSKLGIKYSVIEVERAKVWEVIVSLIVKKGSSYELVFTSDWLPRWSCLNLARTVLLFLPFIIRHIFL